MQLNSSEDKLGPGEVNADQIDYLKDLIDEIIKSTNAGHNRDLIRRLITQSIRLSEDDLDRLDLKILTSALRELRDAFDIFAPFKIRRKLTIFGSARTKVSEDSYQLAKDLACAMATEGWMTVTGGGPGIMEAGMVGAGSNNSFGIGIRLPFEDEGAPSAKAYRVEMKYFFTRKLMLVKESDAFVSLPGGFGTLDETFELLTLMQTGKAQLAPLVLLEPPSCKYFELLSDFMREAIEKGGYISSQDMSLISFAKDVETAKSIITQFYSNFQSMRFVGNQLVIRVKDKPSESLIELLNEHFQDICKNQPDFRPIEVTYEELRDQDCLDCHRIAFTFNKSSYGRLRKAVDLINDNSSSPT